MARNAARKMADGGDVAEAPSFDSTPDTDAELPDQGEGVPAPAEPPPPEQKTAADAAGLVASNASTDQDLAQVTGEQPSEDEEPSAPAKSAPTAHPPLSITKTPVVTPLNIANDLTPETVKRMQDLNSGQISPKTYADFMPKDTMGKIGTYFGLLLSGMGSAVTGQPNALMQMMDKTIDRDLEAQKASKSNQLNLYQLNLQHMQAQTAALRTQYENELTAAQTKGVPEEIKLKQAQIRHYNADIQNLADQHTRNGIMIGALQHLGNQVSARGPSPGHQQAQVALNGVTQAGLGKMQQDNARTQQQIAFRSSLNNMYQEGTPQDEAQFQQMQQYYRMGGLDKIAEDNEAKHLPYVPGRASVPLVQQDRDRAQATQELQASLQRLRDFSVAHPVVAPGSALDAKGKSLAAQVSSSYRGAIGGGVYKEGEQHFINGIIPGDPTAWNPFAQVVPRIDALMSETAARHQGFLHNKGFAVEAPRRGASMTKTANAPSSGKGETIMQDKSGNKYIVRDGKTVGRAP